ncbi:hypothetical protein DTL21_19865 [Bremerella cremea]|uniref:Uncharacterized protein n=1 Tax=Blastopirellula marina TaxID=124 RepID=A0A2S8FJX7_9BACT|nr:hypothetical protein C5Y83_19845 [Blastopirellula marina]RCS45539.1 hypothetical protein DTL21_19865 [Bremerella cremea]
MAKPLPAGAGSTFGLGCGAGSGLGSGFGSGIGSGFGSAFAISAGRFPAAMLAAKVGALSSPPTFISAILSRTATSSAFAASFSPSRRSLPKLALSTNSSIAWP